MTMLRTQNEEIFAEIVSGKSLLSLYIEAQSELEEYKALVKKLNLNTLEGVDVEFIS